MRARAFAALLAAGLAAPALADDTAALRAELKRLAERIEALERQNKEMEKALTTERISEQDPDTWIAAVRSARARGQAGAGRPIREPRRQATWWPGVDVCAGD